MRRRKNPLVEILWSAISPRDRAQSRHSGGDRHRDATVLCRTGLKQYRISPVKILFWGCIELTSIFVHDYT